MHARRTQISWLAVATLALAWVGTARSAAADPPLVTYTAFALNTSNVGKESARTLDIGIERWTTDEEFARLRDTLAEKGGQGLMDEIRKVKPRAGYIRFMTEAVGWDIKYARRSALPGGGHQVVFATDSPMSFAEASSQPRSAEYEFLVADLRFGADGKGQGKLVPMAKIHYNPSSKAIEIENYANEPVRLSDITTSKPK